MMHGLPMSKEMVRSGNSMMVENILQMPVQPYEEGKGVYRVVEMRGRQSGQMRRVPLAVAQYEGKHYLIAPSRGRDWVHNLIAAGECTLLTSAGQEHVHATLTLDDEAVAATQAYIAELGDWTLQQFPFTATASAEEIRAKGEAFAVFRLSF
jgi:deazaflavin-dependent oxidoreductase (nitroreductase family)